MRKVVRLYFINNDIILIDCWHVSILPKSFEKKKKNMHNNILKSFHAMIKNSNIYIYIFLLFLKFKYYTFKYLEIEYTLALKANKVL